MTSNNIFPDLYRFKTQGKEFCSLVAKPYILSELKLSFNKCYTLQIPRLIEIEINNITEKRIIRSFKNFEEDTFVYFKKLDIVLDDFMILPLFSECEFTCLKCKKAHKKGTEQCCSFDGGIMITKATLYKLIIPSFQNVENKINQTRDEFIRLHFPDIFDTMLL
jgi:hypothetical protein